MQWWNDFVNWFFSDDGTAMTFAAIVLAVAVIVSGIISAVIGRAGVRGLLKRQEAQRKTTAIAALVDAATEASVWNSLSPQEQVLADRAVGQADILVRLLPIKGARQAADWASHQLAELKRNSATFGYQLDPAVAEFRDRLVEWERKPGRARRSFEADLERWRFELSNEQRAAVQRQDAWVAEQHHQRHAGPTDTLAVPQQHQPTAGLVGGQNSGARQSASAQATGTQAQGTHPASDQASGVNQDESQASERSSYDLDPETQRLMDDVDRLGPTQR